MLVVASGKELSVYGSEYRFVSFVFQPGSCSQTGELTTNEAIQLVRLPGSALSSAPPALVLVYSV